MHRAGTTKGKPMRDAEFATDHEADALPQAAGERRLSEFYRPSMGKVLVHTEKRGPAFEVANQTMRLVRALDRHVFTDVMAVWLDLLAALGVSPSPLSVGPCEWRVMVAAIRDAMDGGSDGDAVARWAKADEAVRGYALWWADDCCRDAKAERGDDAWDDVAPYRRDIIESLYGQAANLRDFARGKVA